MWAQIRFRLGLVLRSQRAFPLWVILLLAPAVTVPAGGPIVDDYVLIGLLVLPLAAWLAVALTSLGHPTMAQTIVAAAGGRRRIARGSVLIVWAFALSAATLLSIAPYVLGGTGTPEDLGVGWLLMVACTSTAAACGLLAAPLAGRRPAAAFLTAAGCLVVAAAVPGIGTVRVAIDAASARPASPWVVGAAAICSLALLPLAAGAGLAYGDSD